MTQELAMSKRKNVSNATITNYFCSTPKLTKPTLPTTDESISLNKGELGSSTTTSSIIQDNTEKHLEITQPCQSNYSAPKDICKYKQSNYTGLLGDKDKIDVLTYNIWKPDKSYVFPTKNSGNQKRKFSFSWLDKCSWLAYSPEEDSAYCRLCLVFAPSEVGNEKAQQKAGQMVKVGFSSWNKALERFEKHQNSDYHLNSVLKSSDFIKIKDNIKESIDMAIDSSRKKQAEENRKILKPIIETVILCGRQNIPLRGHRDYGPFDLSNPPIEYEDNFRALLRLRISSGDENLKKHFESCAKNATYISWNIQNQIFDASHEIIRDKIVNEVKTAKFFQF